MNSKPNKLEKKSESLTNQKSNISFPNLLPLLYYEYRASMMNTLRNVFLDNLMLLIKQEREFVEKNPGIAPLMTQEKIDQLQDILDKCENVYELQALNDYVFLENYIPTWDEVKSRGLRLKLMYPLLDKPLPRR